MLDEIFLSHQDFFLSHSRVLLTEYRRLLGHNLLPAAVDDAENAWQLWTADFPVLSAGAEEDPLLNYANRRALELWELPAGALGTFPTRQTAEPIHRAAREEFLRQVREQGFVNNYEGIRISTTGRRFLIQNATVWNLHSPDGAYIGQAATFRSWRMLGE